MIYQILGKGGFAREVEFYVPYDASIIQLENEEIKQAIGDTPTIIAIGNPQIRKKIAEENPTLDYHTVVAGINWDYKNKIGKGSIICPGTILTTNIIIGEHVQINLNCTVGHDAVIGNFVTISPGVNISGNVEIGDECYIGTNAVIREKIKICSGVTIGAGAVVVKDITEPGTYVGNPANAIKPKWPLIEPQ